MYTKSYEFIYSQMTLQSKRKVLLFQIDNNNYKGVLNCVCCFDFLYSGKVLTASGFRGPILFEKEKCMGLITLF